MASISQEAAPTSNPQVHVLVTGSTRGIGAAALTALRQGGARVVGHGSRDGGDAVGADLSQPEAADRLWDAALERLDGRVAMPEEVAKAIAYLALQAPPSMTGAVIDINGASFVR